MKKTILAAIGTAFVSLAAFAAPASAMPIHGMSAPANIESVQYRPHGHRVAPPHRVVRPQHMRPRPICRTERVVRRAPSGRPIVRHVRVCR